MKQAFICGDVVIRDVQGLKLWKTVEVFKFFEQIRLQIESAEHLAGSKNGDDK